MPKDSTAEPAAAARHIDPEAVKKQSDNNLRWARTSARRYGCGGQRSRPRGGNPLANSVRIRVAGPRGHTLRLVIDVGT